VYINPSRAEGFGLTPIEALAKDLVVISSDKGATNQYLSSSSAELVHSRWERCEIWPCQKKSLCVFPTDSGSFNKCEMLNEYPSWYSMDEHSLIKTLQNTKAHLKSLASKARAGRNYVCEHFSWSNIANVARHELHPHLSLINRELWSKQFENLKSLSLLVPSITDIIDLNSLEYLNDFFSSPIT
jgi:glycosyltransferase involved in cell wall biosynthesis